MLLLAVSTEEFCQESASVWGVLGYVVMILKIVIPLILIVLGMIDLGKAVVGSDEKHINKAVNTLVMRFVAALAMFFVPTLVSMVFNLFYGNTDKGINHCMQCLTNITSASKKKYQYPTSEKDSSGKVVMKSIEYCKSPVDVSK